MKVFKFGGASIKDANAIKNVVSIIQQFATECPLIVVSASGKTTNALEIVVNEYFAETEEDDIEAAFEEFEGAYTEEEMRLLRIKFLSEMGN